MDILLRLGLVKEMIHEGNMTLQAFSCSKECDALRRHWVNLLGQLTGQIYQRRFACCLKRECFGVLIVFLPVAYAFCCSLLRYIRVSHVFFLGYPPEQYKRNFNSCCSQQKRKLQRILFFSCFVWYIYIYIYYVCILSSGAEVSPQSCFVLSQRVMWD